MTPYAHSAALDEQLRREQLARDWYKGIPASSKKLMSEEAYVHGILRTWNAVRPIRWPTKRNDVRVVQIKKEK